jgi:hypothetical protein
LVPPRSLTQYEMPIVQLINDLGSAHKYEYAAFLESADGPLIEIRVDMRADGADPSNVVHPKAEQGVNIVVHHNHLSQESLSSDDWNGLNEIFDEMFAQCNDGTIYWGRVLDHAKVKKVLDKYGKHEIAAQNYLFNVPHREDEFLGHRTGQRKQGHLAFPGLANIALIRQLRHPAGALSAGVAPAQHGPDVGRE